jgi:AcrR family transcriptional regulator
MTGEGALVIDGVDYRRRLPRGRHGIPPELVSANQSERLLAATATILAESGYASLRVSDIVARAGVSRATFYKFFGDKFDVVLAAQRHAFEGLDRVIAAACEAGGEWPGGVAAAVGAAIEFCAESTDRARLLLASGQAQLEPRLADEGVSLPRQLFVRLRRSAAKQDGVHRPGTVRVEAALSAAISLAGSCVAAKDIGALRRLRPDLIEMSLRPTWAPRKQNASHSPPSAADEREGHAQEVQLVAGALRACRARRGGNRRG